MILHFDVDNLHFDILTFYIHTQVRIGLRQNNVVRLLEPIYLHRCLLVLAYVGFYSYILLNLITKMMNYIRGRLEKISRLI
jgi:hypothetical protein